MDKYIGTKLIEAEPAFRVSNEGEPPEIVTDFGEAKDYQMVDMGYRVRYADGYESWSPANVFERAYLKMTVNPHLKTDKPSISQEMVDDFIAYYDVMTMGEKTTVVRAVLRNGFEIVESSACVSAENYDEKLGADICLKKIKDKVWFLLGFLLQTAVNGVDGEAVLNMAAKEIEADLEDGCDEAAVEGDTEDRYGLDFGQMLRSIRNRGCIAKRRGWNGIGMFIYYVPEGRYPARTEAAKSIAAEDSKVDYGAYIAMKTVQGNVVPWLASQTDMLAHDWEVAEITE